MDLDPPTEHNTALKSDVNSYSDGNKPKPPDVSERILSAIKYDSNLRLDKASLMNKIHKRAFRPFKQGIQALIQNNDPKQRASLTLAIAANINTVDSYGNSPLINAIILCDSLASIDDIKFILECGADVNHVNLYGQNPLAYALNLRRPDVISLLVRYGADIMSSPYTGAHIAFSSFNSSAVDYSSGDKRISIIQDDKAKHTLLYSALCMPYDSIDDQTATLIALLVPDIEAIVAQDVPNDPISGDIDIEPSQLQLNGSIDVSNTTHISSDSVTPSNTSSGIMTTQCNEHIDAVENQDNERLHTIENQCNVHIDVIEKQDKQHNDDNNNDQVDDQFSTYDAYDSTIHDIPNIIIANDATRESMLNSASSSSSSSSHNDDTLVSDISTPRITINTDSFAKSSLSSIIRRTLQDNHDSEDIIALTAGITNPSTVGNTHATGSGATAAVAAAADDDDEIFMASLSEYNQHLKIPDPPSAKNKKNTKSSWFHSNKQRNTEATTRGLSHHLFTVIDPDDIIDPGDTFEVRMITPQERARQAWYEAQGLPIPSHNLLDSYDGESTSDNDSDDDDYDDHDRYIKKSRTPTVESLYAHLHAQYMAIDSRRGNDYSALYNKMVGIRVDSTDPRAIISDHTLLQSTNIDRLLHARKHIYGDDNTKNVSIRKENSIIPIIRSSTISPQILLSDPSFLFSTLAPRPNIHSTAVIIRSAGGINPYIPWLHIILSLIIRHIETHSSLTREYDAIIRKINTFISHTDQNNELNRYLDQITQSQHDDGDDDDHSIRISQTKMAFLSRLLSVSSEHHRWVGIQLENEYYDILQQKGDIEYDIVQLFHIFGLFISWLQHNLWGHGDGDVLSDGPCASLNAQWMGWSPLQMLMLCKVSISLDIFDTFAASSHPLVSLLLPSIPFLPLKKEPSSQSSTTVELVSSIIYSFPNIFTKRSSTPPRPPLVSSHSACSLHPIIIALWYHHPLSTIQALIEYYMPYLLPNLPSQWISSIITALYPLDPYIHTILSPNTMTLKQDDYDSNDIISLSHSLSNATSLSAAYSLSQLSHQSQQDIHDSISQSSFASNINSMINIPSLLPDTEYTMGILNYLILQTSLLSSNPQELFPSPRSPRLCPATNPLDCLHHIREASTYLLDIESLLNTYGYSLPQLPSSSSFQSSDSNKQPADYDVTHDTSSYSESITSSRTMSTTFLDTSPLSLLTLAFSTLSPTPVIYYIINRCKAVDSTTIDSLFSLSPLQVLSSLITLDPISHIITHNNNDNNDNNDNNNDDSGGGDDDDNDIPSWNDIILSYSQFDIHTDMWSNNDMVSLSSSSSYNNNNNTVESIGSSRDSYILYIIACLSIINSIPEGHNALMSYRSTLYSGSNLIQTIFIVHSSLHLLQFVSSLYTSYNELYNAITYTNTSGDTLYDIIYNRSIGISSQYSSMWIRWLQLDLARSSAFLNQHNDSNNNNDGDDNNTRHQFIQQCYEWIDNVESIALPSIHLWINNILSQPSPR